MPVISGGNPSKVLAARLTDPEALDSVVNQLRDIERRTGIERTLAIGELILNQFFGGDPAAWHDRRRNKNNSVRRLAARADCPFSKSALNDAIAVHVTVLGLPCVRTFGHICASHVACVLGLSPQAQQRILETAEREHWSVRELKHQVVVLRRSQGERRGRPAGGDQERVISMMRSGLRELTDGTRNAESLVAMNQETRTSLKALGAELMRLGSELVRLASGERAVAGTRPVSEIRPHERSA